jgi:hypothetical protein
LPSRIGENWHNMGYESEMATLIEYSMVIKASDKPACAADKEVHQALYAGPVNGGIDTWAGCGHSAYW